MGHNNQTAKQEKAQVVKQAEQAANPTLDQTKTAATVQPAAALTPNAPTPGYLSRAWSWLGANIGTPIREFFGNFFTMNTLDRICDGLMGLGALAIMGGALFNIATIGSVGLVVGGVALGVKLVARAFSGYAAPALPVAAPAKA